MHPLDELLDTTPRPRPRRDLRWLADAAIVFVLGPTALWIVGAAFVWGS